MKHELVEALRHVRTRTERLGGDGSAGEDLYGDVGSVCLQKSAIDDWSHPKIARRFLQIAQNLRVRRFRRERLQRFELLTSHRRPELPQRTAKGVSFERAILSGVSGRGRCAT